jgi:Protein of unknown function (DUF3617)
MPGILRISVRAAAFGGLVMLAGTALCSDGIAPGLWRVVSRTETGGVIGPPHESLRCLTPDEAQNVAATFAPPAIAADSGCAPAEHSLNGQKLTWRVSCKGQTDMEQTGEFTFDSPRHYTATMQTRAAVSGTTLIDSQDILEGQWISECQ